MLGGRSPAVRQLAIEHANGWNSWEGTAAEFENFPVKDKELSWGGPPPDVDLAAHLAFLSDVGAAWAIYSPPPSTDWPALVTKLADAAKGVQ